MVRNIVTVLVAVGKKQISPINAFELLQSKDRSLYAHFPAAPPYGLFLVNILYPYECFDEIDSRPFPLP